MEIYNYDAASGALLRHHDAETGELVTQHAFPSPLEEGVFLIPAHATAIAPPEFGAHEIAVFANDAWTVKPDYRAVKLFDTQTGAPAFIADIGVAPEDKGFTDLAPLDTPCKWDAARKQWVDDLDAIKAEKCAELSAACQQAIIGGVVSSALGAQHTYPTQPTDQQNLTANVLASLAPNLPDDSTATQMCADAATPPVWAHRAHTGAQIRQAANDVNAAILAFRVRNTVLQAKVAAAKTVAAVNAIVW